MKKIISIIIKNLFSEKILKEVFVKGGTKVQIQNDKLKDHVIERPLQMLDLSKWEVPDASKDGD